jgi:hypothetical protein
MSVRNCILLPAVLLSACGVAPQAGETPDAKAAALTDPVSGASCAGKDLRIASDAFNLVIEGECGHVVVTGSRGAINVDRATSIRIEGSNVTLLNQQVADVVVTGHDNILNLTGAGALAVEGDRNTVLAREIATVTLTGRDNTVNPDNAPALDDRGTGNRLL